MSEYTREELSESHRILSSLSMRSSTPLEPIPHSPRSSLGNDAKVLPPIILCERDRNILKEITQHIESETEYINEDNVEQAYIIYKGAFDKVSTWNYCIESNNIIYMTFDYQMYLSFLEFIETFYY